MIQVRCPICDKQFQIEKLQDLPSFPFCSDRCRLIDLGRWIDGDYAIPGSQPPLPTSEDADAEEE
jgi:endogenous inhibitor of DNA gyrase (YacG/DUF329 family)